MPIDSPPLEGVQNAEDSADLAVDALVAEQRLANAELRERGAQMPKPGTIAPEILRRARLYRPDGSMRPALAEEARDATVNTPHGSVLTRVFDPPEASGTIVHFHGGGWTLGSVYEQDAMLSALAYAASATCVSLDYPLAPESTLPATLEVATAALAEIIERRAPGPVVIIGESAGAHVALQSVLGLKNRSAIFARIVGLSLSYGIYDLSMTPSQRAWGDAFLGLSTDWLEWFYDLALPGLSRDARSAPSISPLYADLTGLPPALITVGTLDPLLDDSLFLAARWKAAGNKARLRLYPESPHGFNHMATAMAAQCNTEVSTFAAAMLRNATSVATGARPAADR